MSVGVSWDVALRPVPDATLAAACCAALEHGGRAGLAVELILVDDPTLTELHGRFLDDPTPTDVITFDLGEDGEGPAGELYVSVDCADRVSGARGVSLERELCLYIVHGALHLCGFDDHEPEERSAMRAAEAAVMQGLGFEADSAPHDA